MLAKYICLQPMIKNIWSDSFSQNDPENTRATEWNGLLTAGFRILIKFVQENTLVFSPNTTPKPIRLLTAVSTPIRVQAVLGISVHLYLQLRNSRTPNSKMF